MSLSGIVVSGILPVLRPVSTSVAFNYLVPPSPTNPASGAPPSLTFSMAGVSPDATVKLIVNGTQQTTFSVNASGILSSQVWLVPNPVTFDFLKLLAGATFSAGIDNGSGVICSFGATGSGVTASIELSY